MNSKPEWINPKLYPFESKYFELETGKMHYVDEGKGEPVVMVHGNPTWSFLYRNFIKGLSGTNRCIAMDHIGFGLSDKPPEWNYLPEEHAQNLEKLLNHLKLKNITLVVQDWGGPIGLSYALNHPEKIKRLVIMNTWCWPVKDDPHYEKFSGMMGGKIGNFMITRLNFFAKVILKQAYGNKALLTSEIHKHYLSPLGSKENRKGCALFPKEIIGSTPWLSALAEKLKNIEKIPALILWGMKDIAFKEKELQTWQKILQKNLTIKLPEAGHFIQEEAHEKIIAEIKKFIEKS